MVASLIIVNRGCYCRSGVRCTLYACQYLCTCILIPVKRGWLRRTWNWARRHVTVGRTADGGWRVGVRFRWTF